MYNGIGLLTVRGSGTSGYVQTNKFNARRPPVRRTSDASGEGAHNALTRKPNLEILEHNRRREIEVKLLAFREGLEEEGCETVTVLPSCPTSLPFVPHRSPSFS